MTACNCAGNLLVNVTGYFESDKAFTIVDTCGKTTTFIELNYHGLQVLTMFAFGLAIGIFITYLYACGRKNDNM